ncbi:MAG: hypothetical protein K2K81_11340 [Muribaculaceae bacterium]|nr:hypothetical protein [Muribaculaceae bacterium]
MKESGMIFEFAEDNCYCIEEDPLVKKSQCASTFNNKGCECVSFIDGYHCFIEAKSSAPRKRDGDIRDVRLNGKPLPPTWEIYDNYQHFLRDISKKFIDSFFILRSLLEGVHGAKRLKEVAIKEKSIKYDAVRFVLIINFPLREGKTVDKQGLVNLQEALKNEMRPFLNVWKIPDTSIKIVLPEDAAKILHIPVSIEK